LALFLSGRNGSVTENEGWGASIFHLKTRLQYLLFFLQVKLEVVCPLSAYAHIHTYMHICKHEGTRTHTQTHAIWILGHRFPVCQFFLMYLEMHLKWISDVNFFPLCKIRLSCFLVFSFAFIGWHTTW
jgi:hypothetical protein